MGYNTDFTGSFSLSRIANEKEIEFINSISFTRRMKRDVNLLFEKYNGKYGNPYPKDNTPESIYGLDGEYFILDDEFGVIDSNTPPGQFIDGWSNYQLNKKLISEGKCQPGLWCQWIITNDGSHIEWDGNEKFYNYLDWLKYLVNHFFEPWGIKLNGETEWQGENDDDKGTIVVENNIVEILDIRVLRKKKLKKIEQK